MKQTTQSLCPECLTRIDARRVIRANDVFLEKTCPVHGDFSTRIWTGPPHFNEWHRPKIPKSPCVTFHDFEKGCPYDCGLCPEHHQRSCTVIIEVTDRCNLHCPVCYADSGHTPGMDPGMDVIGMWFQRAAQASAGSNIQLSGGEPTVRDDLADIVAMGKHAGFDFIQINTNGIRAADDKAYVKGLKDAGLASAFLQFDGVDDDIYIRIRGKKLLDKKLAAIENFEQYGIGVVLVPTLVPGINDDHAGDILKAAIKMTPAVRAVHFQPVSYFGRYLHGGGRRKRLTLPELMQSIERGTDGLLKVTDFKPPGCENSRCSFHGNYIILPDGQLMPLQKHEPCCANPESAEKGALKAISCVSKQWAAPDKLTDAEPSECVPRPSAGTRKPTESCCDFRQSARSPGKSLLSLDDFIHRARTHTFSVSAMAFQDAWNLDIERVRDCCIHVMSPAGKLIPFCLYNLTARDGKRLYRP